MKTNLYTNIFVVPLPSEPRALVVLIATSTSLTIQWEAPITHHDLLTKYTVSIMGQQLDTAVRNFTIITDSLSAQTYGLYGLEEANLYTISVYAHTDGGEGRHITIMNVLTLEDGELFVYRFIEFRFTRRYSHYSQMLILTK